MLIQRSLLILKVFGNSNIRNSFKEINLIFVSFIKRNRNIKLALRIKLYSCEHWQLLSFDPDDFEKWSDRKSWKRRFCWPILPSSVEKRTRLYWHVLDFGGIDGNRQKNLIKTFRVWADVSTNVSFEMSKIISLIFFPNFLGHL